MRGPNSNSGIGRVTYSASHDPSVDAIRRGYLDAAFVASERPDQQFDQGRIKPDELRVPWTSAPTPHDPIVFRGWLCAELQETIRKAFLSASPEIGEFLERLRAEPFIALTDADCDGLRQAMTRPPAAPDRSGAPRL
jgi:phosphonate transport system substrate-binding protein